MNDCYKTSALAIEDEIPIFSERDSYIENYDKISGDHISAIREDSDNPWITEEAWNQMEEGTLQLVEKYLVEDKCRILDVGVGLGRLLRKIKQSERCEVEPYGMDISMEYLRVSRAKGINVALSKIEDMPYKNDYFDIITCTDVLEHVVDINLCISNIIKVLKPGGILIVRVPNREDLSSYLEPDYPYQMAHVRGFDEYSLELLFTRVFPLQFLEKSPGLLMEKLSLLKYRIPIRGYNMLLRTTLRLCKSISNQWHTRLLERLYYPVEINVVVRKPLS